jgi:hypothetical protein
LKYSLIYPSSLTDQTTDVDDFITADGSVSVDVGEAQAGKPSQTAGYRAVFA